MTFPPLTSPPAVPDTPAILDATGVHTYADLDAAANRIAARLLDGGDDLNEARVCFLAPPGFDYAATQWGIWRAGGVAVPLCVVHPRPELEYVVNDADAAVCVAHPMFEGRLREASGRRVILTTEF
ncbi:MAG: AMP-binding protein, partial [Candidatus Poribacteria bacterium]|nr:AMP-binding protein [Candidatus Poribacteria bacterium]